ncbi:MAG: A/G-specific adenine glycosylase [Gammaproteobacteria bacterium]|nr:A/G-specific adenine glycosylase [Gammaproteobacteria bacterium]
MSKTDHFPDKLLAWFAVHGRHDLPWQRSPNPYRVWISEIMLQQTQVETVRPYFERWMARFPDVDSLAGAGVDEVLHLWSGLGYYARARNLHRAAHIIRDEPGGRFPQTLDAVMALPGIGRSTAGAILALSMNQRHAILDGNVKRVLSRFHAVGGWPGKKTVENELWSLAELHTPTHDVAAYTQAIMDLGATLCTRTRPRCEACPLRADCLARQAGTQAAFPARRPKKARPLKATVMAIFLDGDGKVLLHKRPPSGIWGGLWSLPEFSTAADLREHLETSGIVDPQMETWPVMAHGFTHYQLAITPTVVRLQTLSDKIADDRAVRWIDPSAPPAMGLAAPVSKLLDQMVQASVA